MNAKPRNTTQMSSDTMTWASPVADRLALGNVVAASESTYTRAPRPSDPVSRGQVELAAHPLRLAQDRVRAARDQRSERAEETTSASRRKLVPQPAGDQP